jgi:hypothetical protein
MEPRRELPIDELLRIRARRVEQGLPPTVEDTAVLSRVAALLDADERAPDVRTA